jgi:hypothetical protein
LEEMDHQNRLWRRKISFRPSRNAYVPNGRMWLWAGTRRNLFCDLHFEIEFC